MDMAGAYAMDGLDSLIRRIEMNDDCVRLTDTFDYKGEGDIVDRVVTRTQPVIGENGIVTVGKGSLIYNVDDADIDVTSEIDSKNNAIWFIDLKLKKGIKSITYLMK